MQMPEPTTGCPYCSCTDGVFVARKEPQESVTPFFCSDFSLYCCSGCGLYYCSPITPEVLRGLGAYFAECYNNKDRIYDPAQIVAEIWRATPLRDALRAVYRRLRPQTEFPPGRAGEGMAILRACGVRSLLDVGCSYGAFVRTALQHGIDAYGVEPNKEVVALIRQRSVERVVAGFFPDQTGPLGRYDAVIFFQVLMYWHDLSPAFFQKCKGILNPGGLLVVFGNDPAQREAQEVKRAFSVPLVVNLTGEGFMRRAAKDAGFSAYAYIPCRGEPTSCFHVLTV
jgi:SAM-dependent methyltransferase